MTPTKRTVPVPQFHCWFGERQVVGVSGVRGHQPLRSTGSRLTAIKKDCELDQKMKTLSFTVLQGVQSGVTDLEQSIQVTIPETIAYLRPYFPTSCVSATVEIWQ